MMQDANKTGYRKWKSFRDSGSPFNRKDPQSVQLTAYNLHFTIKKPVKPQKKHMLSPLPHQTSLNFRSSIELDSRSHRPLQQQLTGSESSRQKGAFEGDWASQSAELDYIGLRFPQRKKRSGQEQFVKLLLKLAGEATTRKGPAKHSLFQQQQTPKNQSQPKVKPRVRLNWVKERYCANRDRQKSMFLGKSLDRTRHQANNRL